jgi:radical SAM-linked protein
VRVRFRFSKCGKVRFTSHRDVARLWERALRRAALPVASTEGFSPRPKMHFGLALSTGHESLGEYLDVDFREPSFGEAPVDVSALPLLLSPLLPDGLEIEAAWVIDRSGPSLQEAVTSCCWRIEVSGVAPERLEAAVDAVLAAEQLPVTRERKGKQVDDDLRPAVLELAVANSAADPDEHVVLEVELATQPRGVRPSEFLATLSSFLVDASSNVAAALEESRVTRTHQWIELDGARWELLPPDATRAVHAEARAS